MRTTTLFILAAILVAIPFGAAASSSSQNAMKDCNAQWKTLDTTTKGATTHNAFMSSCMKGAKGNTAGSTANSMMNGATNAVGNTGHAVGRAASGAMGAAGNAMNGATHAVGGAAGAAGAAVTSGVAGAGAMMGGTKTASHSHSKIPVEGNTGTAARCNDGTTMQIHTHSGACSHHGGVAAWL